MRTRKDILIDLVRNENDIPRLTRELSHYPWDSEDILYTINSEDIRTILEIYLENTLDPKTLEDWANAIECREDLGFESAGLQEIINELANPVLFGSLSHERIAAYKDKLQSI